jgi:hypothetical protein
MTDSPSPGEKLAGIAGLALLLIMFLFAWYSWPSVGGISSSLNGLDAFDAYDDWVGLILVFAAFSGMALALFGNGMARIPISLSILSTVLGGISAIVVLIFIVSTPSGPTFGAGGGLAEGSLGVEPGAWLGLIASVLLAIGGYMTMQEEGTSFADAADRLSRGRGGGEPPQSGVGEHYPPPPQQPPPPDVQQPPPPPAPPTQQPPPPPPPPPQSY